MIASDLSFYEWLQWIIFALVLFIFEIFSWQTHKEKCTKNEVGSLRSHTDLTSKMTLLGKCRDSKIFLPPAYVVRREGTVFTGVCLLTFRGVGVGAGSTLFPGPRGGGVGYPFPGPVGRVGVPPFQVQVGAGQGGGYLLPRSRWGGRSE